MQKKFLSSLGLILLLNLLVKPFYILGIDATVQNRVGQEAYGLYFALLNLSFIFNILIDFGINNFNNRNIARNSELIGSHFSRLFTVKGLLAGVYAVVTLFIGWVLGYAGTAFWMLLVLVFNQVIVSFILFARSNLAALHLFKSDSVVSVLDRSLLIVFCGILLFTNLTGGRFEILWFAYLQTAAYIITLLISLAMLAKYTGRLNWHFDRSFSMEIFRKSVPYALYILMGAMYTRVDGIMLEKLLPDGALQAGYYAQGYRFYEAAGMFAFLFAVLLLPIFSRMLKNAEDIRPMIDTAARLLLGAGVFSAVFFFFHGEWILRWRYSHVISASVQSFIQLMFAFIGYCMFYIYGTLMTANENLKALNFIAFAGLGLNLIFNFILIPAYGAPGAAFTTMTTQIFAGLAQLVFVFIHFKLKVNYALTSRFALFLIIFTILNYVLLRVMPEGWGALMLSAGMGVGALMLLGIISPRHFVRLLKSEK